MSITVNFECSGCWDKSPGTKPLGRKFVSITGRSYGFGSYQYDTIDDVIPEGWISYDIVGCTYCPKCASELYPTQKEEN